MCILFGRIPNGMCSSIVIINHYQNMTRSGSSFFYSPVFSCNLYLYLRCVIHNQFILVDYFHGIYHISIQHGLYVSLFKVIWKLEMYSNVVFFLHHTDLIAWGKNWATSSFISLHDKSCDFSYISLTKWLQNLRLQVDSGYYTKNA